MLDWWKYNGPPVYVSAAAYVGLLKERPAAQTKPGSPAPQKETGNLDELEQMFRGTGGFIQ